MTECQRCGSDTETTTTCGICKREVCDKCMSPGGDLCCDCEAEVVSDEIRAKNEAEAEADAIAEARDQYLAEQAADMWAEYLASGGDDGWG